MSPQTSTMHEGGKASSGKSKSAPAQEKPKSTEHAFVATAPENAQQPIKASAPKVESVQGIAQQSTHGQVQEPAQKSTQNSGKGSIQGLIQELMAIPSELAAGGDNQAMRDSLNGGLDEKVAGSDLATQGTEVAGLANVADPLLNADATKAEDAQNTSDSASSAADAKQSSFQQSAAEAGVGQSSLPASSKDAEAAAATARIFQSSLTEQSSNMQAIAVADQTTATAQQPAVENGASDPSAVAQPSSATQSVADRKNLAGGNVVPARNIAEPTKLNLRNKVQVSSADAQSQKVARKSNSAAEPVGSSDQSSATAALTDQGAQDDQQGNTPKIVSPSHEVNSTVGVASFVTTADSTRTFDSPIASPQYQRTDRAIAHQEQFDTAASGINAAQVLQSFNQSEMRVGMRSAEFGEISVRTAISQQQMTTQISVEHHELGSAIASHTSTLAAKLDADYGLHASIDVKQSGASFSSEGGRSQQQQEQRPVNRSFEPLVKSREADSEHMPVQISSLGGESYRLDIRA